MCVSFNSGSENSELRGFGVSGTVIRKIMCVFLLTLGQRILNWWASEYLVQ